MSEKPRIAALLAPPMEPLTEPWEVSTGGLIRRLYDVPAVASKVLRQLDRFGAVRIAPTLVGFDNKDVPWVKIRSVQTRPLRDTLTETALDREVERLRKLLPPVPGRKWVLERAAAALGELSRAALDRTAAESVNRSVVASIEYSGGLGRKATMSAGLIVSAVLGLVPDANRILMDMAEQHGGATVQVHQ